MGNRERAERLRERRAGAGMVQVNVWLPAKAAPEFKRAAELVRAEPELRLARLVDMRTGRLRGLS